jgi:hypothetical protein
MDSIHYAKRRTVLKMAAATLLGGCLATGTASARRAGTASERTAQEDESVVRVVAEHDHGTDEHRFEFSTHEFASGWTTFEFVNGTEHTHFVYLARLPDSAIEAAGERELLGFYVEQVTEPFQGIMDSLLGREPRHRTELPAWYGDVLPRGGPGLTSSGERATSTMYLEAGEYIAECYVKNDEGEFHSYLGMIDHLTVTDERSALSRPESTLEVSVSTTGIEAQRRVPHGRHTVEVRFEDQRVYDHFLGHDVHLIRLDEGTDVEDVNGWMNWMTDGGLASGESEPGTFVGGVETVLYPALLAGATCKRAYMEVDLTPGHYAWVAEVPNPVGKGMLMEFDVPPCPEGSGERNDEDDGEVNDSGDQGEGERE